MKDLESKLFKLLKQKPFSEEELHILTTVEIDELQQVINSMKGRGVSFSKTPEGKIYIPSAENTSEYRVLSPLSNEYKQTRFISSSDTHIGCIQHDDVGLETCVKQAIDEGAEFALHSGDIVDGFGVYHGQLNYLITWKVDEQTDMAAEEIERTGLHWFGIGGNHDHSYTLRSGIRPSKLVGMKTDKWHDLGDFQADIIVQGIDIRLLHGSGGNAYAQSYPAQKFLRNLAEGTPEQVPDILLLGHYHTNPVFQIYNCVVLHPGNFQKPNDYFTRMGLRGARGLYLVTLETQFGRILSYQTKFIKAKE